MSEVKATPHTSKGMYSRWCGGVETGPLSPLSCHRDMKSVMTSMKGTLREASQQALWAALQGLMFLRDTTLSLLYRGTVTPFQRVRQKRGGMGGQRGAQRR